jgi:hypothetical protein
MTSDHWTVEVTNCPECWGKGEMNYSVSCPDGRVGCLVAHFAMEHCRTCFGYGWVPMGGDDD